MNTDRRDGGSLSVAILIAFLLLIWRASLRPSVVSAARRRSSQRKFVFAAEQVAFYRFAISALTGDHLQNLRTELGPPCDRHSDKGGHKRRAAPYDGDCCPDQLGKSVALVAKIKFDRMLDEHRRTAVGQTISAGKSSRWQPEKKKTAAAARRFACDPKAATVTADKKQRNWVTEKRMIGARG
jgi:hypothetical protein